MQPTTSQLHYIQVLVVGQVLSATSLEGSVLLVGDEDPGTADSCLNCSSVRQGIILAVDTRRMEAFHIKCQRQITKICWQNHVRNSEGSALNQVLDLIMCRWNSVFGHISRLFEDMPAHQVL